MATDSKSLVAALHECKLIEPARLPEVESLQTQFADAKGLGAQLIRAGFLTPYQANQLLQGRAADLVMGPYRLLERIGEGGMGQVFKARHEHLHRIVALKVIRRDRLSDPLALDRFRREARAAAQLSHPNIVTVYDASQAGGTQYLAMEYVDGTDLAKMVKDSGPLAIRRACDYARQAACGLAHAHERGLIHRDIKPHNLLVTSAQDLESAEWGTVKILDMGLARSQISENGAGDPALTRADSLLGTPDYMAPEQAKHSRAADARSDLYSLGCTLFFLLTGRPPFGGSNPFEKVMRHQLDEAPSVRTLRPDVPEALELIVATLMAKRPEDRFADAASLVEALAPFCTDATPTPLRRPLIAASGRRQRRAGIAAALAAVALLGVCMFAFSGPAENPASPASESAAPASTQSATADPTPPAGTNATTPHERSTRHGRDRWFPPRGSWRHR